MSTTPPIPQRRHELPARTQSQVHRAASTPPERSAPEEEFVRTREITVPIAVASLALAIVALFIALSSAQDTGPADEAAASAGAGRSSATAPRTAHEEGGRGTSKGDAHAANTDAGAASAKDQPAPKVEDGKLDTLEPVSRANGVVTFELEAAPVRVNLGDGTVVDGMGYNGSVPGPTINVEEGERVKVVFTNRLDEATTVHWHGVDVPFAADGVPGLTQDAVKPGETYTYEFDAKPAGTHFYHTHGSGTHGEEAGQMTAGLAGALIIHRKGERKVDVDMPLILGGGMGGKYTLNGAVFPHGAPLEVKRGQLVRVRMINAGSAAIHPMHVHGHQVQVESLDGNLVPPGMRMLRSTVTVNPGETADILVRAYNPGKWVIHCHDLNHVTGGMAMPFLYAK